MPTIKSKEDAAYVVASDDLIPLTNFPGTVGKSVHPKQLGDAIGLRNVIEATPTTEQVYVSPICGDPDFAEQQNIGGVQHLLAGFLFPEAGVVTEIGMVCQASTGTATTESVRWSVCAIAKQNSSPTGLVHESTLSTGLVDVPGNSDGLTVLANGLTIAVPRTFVIAIKSGVISSNIFVQSMKSAGPIPGMISAIAAGNGSIVSTPTYVFNSTDFSNPPGQVVLGDAIGTALYKGFAFYIKWKAA